MTGGASFSTDAILTHRYRSTNDDALRVDSVVRAVAAAPLRVRCERLLRPGEILSSRYCIERCVGAGGMGVVYAARDLQLGRAVAIKLARSSIDPAAAEKRLAREARAMAALRHTNVARVYDTGVLGQRLFVVMELVDGGTLADWLSAGRHSWWQVVRMFLQAARGLAAVHSAGLVHRDFKPDNVLVGSDGVVRVSDFGVVRFVRETDPMPLEVSGTGTMVGTPGYMAPELSRGVRGDARADQYSLCVALFAALYGERPARVLAGPPREGRAPRWLYHIVARGLASAPEARWPNVAALARAIEDRLPRKLTRFGRARLYPGSVASRPRVDVSA